VTADVALRSHNQVLAAAHVGLERVVISQRGEGYDGDQVSVRRAEIGSSPAPPKTTSFVNLEGLLSARPPGQSTGCGLEPNVL
jgi:hypothetical protein